MGSRKLVCAIFLAIISSFLLVTPVTANEDLSFKLFEHGMQIKNVENLPEKVEIRKVRITDGTARVFFRLYISKHTNSRLYKHYKKMIKYDNIDIVEKKDADAGDSYIIVSFEKIDNSLFQSLDSKLFSDIAASVKLKYLIRVISTILNTMKELEEHEERIISASNAKDKLDSPISVYKKIKALLDEDNKQNISFFKKISDLERKFFKAKICGFASDNSWLECSKSKEILTFIRKKITKIGSIVKDKQNFFSKIKKECEDILENIDQKNKIIMQKWKSLECKNKNLFDVFLALKDLDSISSYFSCHTVEAKLFETWHSDYQKLRQSFNNLEQKPAALSNILSEIEKLDPETLSKEGSLDEKGLLDKISEFKETAIKICNDQELILDNIESLVSPETLQKLFSATSQVVESFLKDQYQNVDRLLSRLQDLKTEFPKDDDFIDKINKLKNNKNPKEIQELINEYKLSLRGLNILHCFPRKSYTFFKLVEAFESSLALISECRRFQPNESSGDESDLEITRL